MKITRSKLIEIIRETINELDENPCWDGYEAYGTKTKDGKEVPNCVPVSEANVIRALKEGDTEYQDYFRKELEKTGKSSPADMTDDEKRDFFTNVDKGWNGKTESINEKEDDIKVGSKVVISSPWSKRPFNDVVSYILKHPKDGSPLYVLKKNPGVWSKPYISLAESVKEKEDDIKVGSKVVLSSPWSKRPLNDVVKRILKHPKDGSPLYVLKKNPGVWSKPDISLAESVNEGLKHFIHVGTPKEIVSKSVESQILALAKKGVRSNEIGLNMHFVGNDKSAVDAFQKVKNKVYFKLDKR